MALALAFLSPTNSTAAGTCLYSFIMPTCIRVFFRLFTQVHLWLMAQSKVNIQHSSLPLFFKMSTCGHFPDVPLHPFCTHILQIMLKDSNSKNTKRNYCKNNTILIRRPPFHYVTFAQANYYLNLFHTIFCAVGYLDKHASKYDTGVLSNPPKTQ